MKKVTCLFNDSKLLEKVESFCTKERFTCESISRLEDFVYDVSMVLFLTDDAEKICTESLKDVPACYVGEGRTCCITKYRLPSDFEPIHLRCLVDAVVHSGCFEVASASASPVFLSKIFKIRNDIFSIDKVAFALTKDFVYFLDFQALEKVRVGLSEMLTNAIEHGNLNITGEDKLHATEDGTYYELVNKKLSDKKYTDRRVTFFYKIDPEGIIMEIEDEGNGFKVDELPDPTDPESLLKLHGRGILITRMYFDEVSYNDKGNKVTLRKRF